MADKKTTKADAVELEEADLDQVTGGAADSHDAYANQEVSHLKSSLTDAKGIRATKKVGIRATKGLSKTGKDIMAQGGTGSI